MSTVDPATTEQEALSLRFREAMAHLGAAANIVTSDGPGGRVGFAATAICSVTDSPPTLLVCLNRNASVYEAVIKNAVICVNTLAFGHEDLANLFGGKTPQEERFAKAEWTTLVTSAPVLDDALVSFDCRISETSRTGSHDVLFSQIQAIRIHPRPTSGLIYFGRTYHSVRKG